MSWLKEVIGTEKAIIAMLHMQPMPGDPYFDKAKGMKWVIEKAREDLDALPDSAYALLDYAKIGKQMREDEAGVFTPHGYVVRTEE